MNNKIQRFFQQLTPFLVLGIVIALIFCLFILFVHIVLWGIFIGACIWLVAAIRNYFFSKQKLTNQHGRIIEYDKKDEN